MTYLRQVSSPASCLEIDSGSMPVYSVSGATASTVLSTQPAVSTAAGASQAEADMVLVLIEWMWMSADGVEEVELMKVRRGDDLSEVTMK